MTWLDCQQRLTVQENQCTLRTLWTHVHAGHFDLIVVIDKHETNYSGTGLENAVMLGDTADDDIKHM